MASTLQMNSNFSIFCDIVDRDDKQIVIWLDFNNTYENWRINSTNNDILIRKRTNLNWNTNALDVCSDTDHQYFNRYYFYQNIINVPGNFISFWYSVAQSISLSKQKFIRTYQYDSSNRFG